jgi:hypothetical protein
MKVYWTLEARERQTQMGTRAQAKFSDIADMPTLSEFFGILIRMYRDDHPPPHFQALYGEHEAQYNIATLDVIEARSRVVLTRW